MALARDFKETILARVQRDPNFRDALLKEGIETLRVGGALNNGVTKEELQEIFLHASVYCGFPAAVDAFRAAAEVVDGAAS